MFGWINSSWGINVKTAISVEVGHGAAVAVEVGIPVVVIDSGSPTIAVRSAVKNVSENVTW